MAYVERPSDAYYAELSYYSRNPECGMGWAAR